MLYKVELKFKKKCAYGWVGGSKICLMDAYSSQHLVLAYKINLNFLLKKTGASLNFDPTN